MLLLVLWACTPAEDVPSAEVLIAEPDRSEIIGNGVLVTITPDVGQPGYAALLDSDGQVRWKRHLPGKVLRVRSHSAGDGIWVLLDAEEGTSARIQRETLEGELLSVTTAGDAHHDVLELADGRIAWLEHIQDVAPLPIDPEAPISTCLLYTSPSPRDRTRSRMPSSA